MRGGVETAISPVFGLALLQLADLIAVIAALASIAVAITIGMSIRRNTELAKQSRDQLERHAKQTEEHAEQTHKIASANLAMKLLEYWDESKYKDFASMVEDVAQDKVKKDDPRLGSYLGMWEEIAVFYNDDVLTETHTYEFFTADLQSIRDNDIVYGYLKAKSDKGVYLNLWDMLCALTSKPSS